MKIGFLACILAILAQQPGLAAYTILSQPDGVAGYNTSLYLGNSGLLAATCTDSTTNERHAYVFSGGAFHKLTPMGATSSEVQAVSDSDRVVGKCKMGVYEKVFTWSLADGVEVPAVPGSASTHFSAIAPDGRIVGYYKTIAGNAQAFTWHAGTTTDLTPAGATSSGAHAINASGLIIGTFKTAAKPKDQPCAWIDGVFTALPLPAGTTGGFAIGIGDDGRIIGAYTAANNALHACIWSTIASQPVDLSPPGATQSFATGIDPTGQVIGIVQVGTESAHGIWAAGTAESFASLTPAGATGLVAPLLSASGRIAITYEDAAGKVQTVVYADGSFTTILPIAITAGTATAINSSGQVVGNAIPAGDVSNAFAFVWDGASLFQLLPPGTTTSSAHAISDSGLVTGICRKADGTWRIFQCIAADGANLTTPISDAPVVKVNGKKKIKTTKAKLRLEGIATGAVTGIACKLGKKTVSARGTTAWTCKIGLAPGRNRIMVIATGPGGSSAPAKITVIRK